MLNGKSQTHRTSIDLLRVTKELVSIDYHKLLMTQLGLTLPSCFINIGGISNLSYWDGNSLIGFDAGPGNCLMDSYMKNIFGLDYDDKGELASTGKINNKI